ncbi:MAG: hypothetical protein A3B07_03290 [Candidatus Yonathbacteria bacterium RIFCSPLOWO2_01_FULL_43_27]|uniref:Uncharacterized protein n=2 Tax=Parcubacteria group TaxID=1794811 RepID=A0A1G2SCX0_9BACT|nr:MAG: hypothetical protein UW78_C0006G0069 [Candidatus Azambacteria bacterium GW2011_GWA1_44_9]OHA78809.1 MAG: hypothetical protein A2658_00240 [Candidatus Yonathbacteria bacterium RIFCSPHIGHO2_01_FULL_44_19]OHA82886.1 MAG: hypothetical protein A3B07_03290 [Candidatus Yonathbacteria bacterium RIFCSPLOWO2_01_FULL_43_27]
MDNPVSFVCPICKNTKYGEVLREPVMMGGRNAVSHHYCTKCTFMFLFPTSFTEPKNELNSTTVLYSKERCKHTTTIRTAGGELQVMCEKRKGHEGMHQRSAHQLDSIKEDELKTGWEISWGEWGSTT